MATIYVDSNATGGGQTGADWANAFLTLTHATVLGSAAGQEIWVAHNHKETGTSAVSIAFTAADNYGNPIRVLCVNTGTNELDTGAEVETTGGASDITLSGDCLYVYGIRFDTTDDLTIASAFDNIVLDHCVLEVTDALNLSGTLHNGVHLIGCTLDNKDTSLLNILTSGEQYITIRDCVFAASGGTPTSEIFAKADSGAVVVITDCDLSARSGSALIDSATTGAAGKVNTFTFRRCKLPTGYTVFSTDIAEPSTEVLLEACDDGTITDPPLMEYYTYYGTVKADLTHHYRTGGADDGENANAYSWAMVATANRTVETYTPLRSPPITIWTDPKSSISGATARGLFSNSTRCAPLGTPANITADAVSTWNGADVGTKQKLTHTLSNGSTLTLYFASDATMQTDEVWMEVSEPDQVGGPVSVVVCLAKAAGDTIYVDPKLEIT